MEPSRSPGAKICLESADHVLRTMEPADAELDWGGWLANPATARMLNTTPRTLSLSDKQRYIAKFDSKAAHLLGIWEKGSDRLVGFWSIYVDEIGKEFLLNVLVGVDDARAKGAQDDTCDLIYEHFFDRLGMKAVRGTVSQSNAKMIAHLAQRRWTRIGSSEKAAATGAKPIKIYLYRLTREDWRARVAGGRREDGSRRAG
ncbi:MAG: GNAT family N-acetyltransferase [Alphaproteobacteria bacterium]|nr:GNAT family N-acetyltransferase [Alphaproteobacteria bacterium]